VRPCRRGHAETPRGSFQAPISTCPLNTQLVPQTPTQATISTGIPMRGILQLSLSRLSLARTSVKRSPLFFLIATFLRAGSILSDILDKLSWTLVFTPGRPGYEQTRPPQTRPPRTARQTPAGWPQIAQPCGSNWHGGTSFCPHRNFRFEVCGTLFAMRKPGFHSRVGVYFS
jgi:hypothetical protein